MWRQMEGQKQVESLFGPWWWNIGCKDTRWLQGWGMGMTRRVTCYIMLKSWLGSWRIWGHMECSFQLCQYWGVLCWNAHGETDVQHCRDSERCFVSLSAACPLSFSPFLPVSLAHLSLHLSVTIIISLHMCVPACSCAYKAHHNLPLRAYLCGFPHFMLLWNYCKRST